MYFYNFKIAHFGVFLHTGAAAKGQYSVILFPHQASGWLSRVAKKAMGALLPSGPSESLRADGYHHHRGQSY